MNGNTVSAINALGEGVSETKKAQFEMLAQSVSPNEVQQNNNVNDVQPNESVTESGNVPIERYSSSFGKMLEITGVPEVAGASDTLSQQLGGLRIRAEKGNISSDLAAETDPMLNDITEGFRELVQKSIVYTAFWGTIRKTQTEFKQMSHGQ